MKYALIAGAESGLAQATIKLLAEHDFFVFAADIKYTEIAESEKVCKIPADLTNSRSVRNLYDIVSARCNGLDVVANFAGIVTLGSFVESDLDAMDKILAVNLCSTYKINNVFFPLIKNVRGRIINISSEYGKIDAMPFHGFYPVSKHAVEVYNDSLRREMQKVGVKVIEMRPGAFATNMQQGVESQFEKVVANSENFSETLLKMQGLMTGELGKAKDPAIFAKKFLHAATCKHPKKYYNVKNSFKMKLYSLCPAWLQDFVFRKIF